MASKNYQELQDELKARPDHPDLAATASALLAAEDATYFRRLAELRQARQMTQVELAKNLRMVQPSVSRLERQADLYVSTLRRYVEALGGRLEINAIFPDLDYELRFDDFASISQDNPESDQDVAHAL